MRAAVGLAVLWVGCGGSPAVEPGAQALDIQAQTDVTAVAMDAGVDSAQDAATDAMADVALAVADAVTGAVDAGVDASPAADGDAGADVPAKPKPLGAWTQTLADAAAVKQVLNLHQVIATGVRQVVERQYENGDAKCPGLLAKTGTAYADSFFSACTIHKDAYDVELFGGWNLSYSDPCKSAPAHQLYQFQTATPTTLKGKDGASVVDLAIDLSLSVDSSAGGLAYAWQGKTVWKKLPTAWLPATAEIVTGHTVKGEAVARTGTTQAGTALTGWLDVDGAGVQFETVQPLKWLAIPQCFVPTSGKLRLHGAATVDITFAPGPTCAPPTWTRDGVAMGSLEVTFWGWLVLCGAGGPP